MDIQRITPDHDRHLRTAVLLHLGAVTAAIVEGLKEHGLAPLLLRGPVLARLLYDDDLERTYTDVDLLLPGGSLPAARRVLATLSFSPSEIEIEHAVHRPLHAETWIRARDNASVDLHRSLIGAAVSPDQLWDVFWRERERLSLGGTAVEIPGEAACAFAIALHAAQHGPSWSRPLDDLSRALSRLPIETWKSAASVAAECEAVAAFAAGLHLLPKGRAIAEELGLGAPAVPDASLRGGEQFHVAQGIQWMLALDGVLPKIRFAVRKAFPPPAVMRLRFSVASRGRAGLALAYATRLGRLTWYAGPALYAEVTTRRQKRASLGRRST